MKILRKIINIVLVLIIIFCLYKIIYKQVEYYKANKANNNIQQLMEVKTPNESILNKEKELKSINSDYKCWIKIPNTEVNYPVVQGNNNEYYLHHNFKNEESIEGNIFIYDKYNPNTSRNLLVFGHNMRNGSMFGSLWPYKDTNFFNENKYIYIMEGDTLYKYEIFGDAVVHDYNPYLKVNFANQQEFDKYISDFKSHAYFWRDVPIDENTKLLTLSTCSYEFNEARFVIVSKLVDTSKLTQTEMVKLDSNKKMSTKLKIEYALKEYYLVLILAAIGLVIIIYLAGKKVRKNKKKKER